MCGIVGQIGGPRDDGRAEARLERACRQMVHRGPDSGGTYVRGAARLGFRRLAILDLSPAGHQPMTAEDEQVALVFNGEIYNYRSLRRALRPHVSFASETDSEVLLRGYLVWGWKELLRRIDGMFAVAIWDARKQQLYAARDRSGKKPLFYRHDGQRLTFASTLHALRAMTDDEPEIDPVALDAYLTYQAVPAPLSIFEGIRQVPPAHALHFDAGSGRLAVERYWDVGFVPKVDRSEDEVLDELDDLVRQAVRKRLMSDVPLGAFLSGGVDSSLVVAMMAQEQDDPVEGVVMGFEDPAFDERPYARMVARRWGVNLHEHVLAPDAVADLPEIIWQYGQPLADVSIVPTYYVARAARQHVTVVLNGDGGDEVFGGYARPMVARAAMWYRRFLPEGVRRLAARGVQHLNGWTAQGVLKKARMLVEAGEGPARDAFVYDRAFRSYRQAAYAPPLGQALRGHHPDALYRSVWDRASGDDVDRALYGDFTTYLPDQLLAKMDVSTMAHSLEARAPLLDTALIEYAARIPTALRLKGFTTKYLLKKLAERYVPHEVLYRRKRGFVMPASDWLRGDLAPYLRRALRSDAFAQRGWVRPAFADRLLREHMGGEADWGEQLWTLFVLEVWARMTLDGTMQRTDSLEVLR